MENTMEKINENNRISKEIEEKILMILDEDSASILDSQRLIDTLNDSKEKTDSIKSSSA